MDSESKTIKISDSVTREQRRFLLSEITAVRGISAAETHTGSSHNKFPLQVVLSSANARRLRLAMAGLADDMDVVFSSVSALRLFCSIIMLVDPSKVLTTDTEVK